MHTPMNLLLQEELAGGELNIVFDNYSGQNKNNMVLKLTAWLKQMGYFKQVNFVFLVVGHTKNAADSSFNSLKLKYWKQNIYFMLDLIQCLNMSDSATVVPTKKEDFLDYDALFDDIYGDLAGIVKQNHIFSCGGDSDDMIPIIQLCESNLDEHKTVNHKATKKTQKLNNVSKLRSHSISLLLVIKCLGLNPYKVVEMGKNYCPMIPVQFQDNALYAELDASIKAKVKYEKMF